MGKGFSNNEQQINIQSNDIRKPKKGIASFLAGKKITYTLPGKRQINIFAAIVLSLNLFLILIVFLYLKNQTFHDFVFNIGR